MIEMVYIYEILHDYSGVMPDVVGNWEFENKKFDEDDGSEEFILTNFDPEKHEQIPLFKMRRHGFIAGVTKDELLAELKKGIEHGTKYLESHGITVPESASKVPANEKKKFIRARPIGENQWVYDYPENRKEYKNDNDGDGVEWEIEEIMLTQDEFDEFPEFTGW